MHRLRRQWQVYSEGLKGCYDVENVRPISTLVFSFYTIGGAASQIFGAIKDDIMEAVPGLSGSHGLSPHTFLDGCRGARGHPDPKNDKFSVP